MTGQVPIGPSPDLDALDLGPTSAPEPAHIRVPKGTKITYAPGNGQAPTGPDLVTDPAITLSVGQSSGQSPVERAMHRPHQLPILDRWHNIHFWCEQRGDEWLVIEYSRHGESIRGLYSTKREAAARYLELNRAAQRRGAGVKRDPSWSIEALEKRGQAAPASIPVPRPHLEINDRVTFMYFTRTLQGTVIEINNDLVRIQWDEGWQRDYDLNDTTVWQKYRGTAPITEEPQQ